MKRAEDFIIRNPFIALFVAIATGIICAMQQLIDGQILIWVMGPVVIVLFLLSALSQRYRHWLGISLLLGVAIFSGIRFFQKTNILPANHIVFQKRSGEVTGIISETAYISQKANRYVLESKRIFTDLGDSVQVCGRLLFSSKASLEYGDVVRVKTNWNFPTSARNPGQFDYRHYLQNKDILLTAFNVPPDSIEVLGQNGGNIFIAQIIFPAKNYIEKTISTYLDVHTAGVIKALLTGEKNDIDRQIREEFKLTGVVHVLAVSGLHVGFIMIFVISVLQFFRIPLRYRNYAVIIALFIYVALVNFKPPVIRASMMASMYLLAISWQRKANIYNIIFTAAAVILIAEPRYLTDAGFQFSFLAVLSIVFGYKRLDSIISIRPKINEKFSEIPLARNFLIYIWASFLVSVSAVIGTLPLTVYYYGMIPVLAFLANIIVIPAIALIVFLSIFMIVFSFFSGFLASGVAQIIDLFFGWLRAMIGFTVSLPFSKIETVYPGLAEILFMYLLIILILNWSFIKYRSIPLVLLLVFTVYLIFPKNASGRLETVFFDVGQGDAAFVRFPNNTTMLIDGGDANSKWDNGKNVIIPFLKSYGINKINYMVVSHPHHDHLGGLYSVLKVFEPDTLVVSPYKYNSNKYRQFLALAAERSIPLKIVEKGDRLYPDPACRVYILHPDKEYSVAQSMSGDECNNSSVVMKIQYGANGVLFTGDLEKTAEKHVNLYGDFLESELIKIGHHGSSTSTSNTFLQHVRPLAGVISVAEKNKFRHPSKYTLLKLANFNSRIMQTKNGGALVFHVYPQEIHKISW